MSEVFGDIRDSLWLDVKDRIEEAGLNEFFHLDEGEMTATYLVNGNTIVSKGFKKASKKQTAKLKSLAGATHVLVEEMEEISEADFKQLDDTLRTTKTQNIQLIGLFNPPAKSHWIWKTWYNLVDSEIQGFFRAIPRENPALLSIFSTYRDNLKNLNASFVRNMKAYLETDPEYYYTIVEGLISEGVRGRIFRNWNRIEDMPCIYEKFYGLDFGYNHPTALVECEAHKKDLYVKELIYESNLTNQDISAKLTALGIKKTSRIYVDSAEPKSWEELRRLGWNVIKAQKGPDSITSGINFIKEYTVHATEKSFNLWNEYENYHWVLDQEKRSTNDAEDKFNHLMDAIRYAMDKIRKPAPGLKVIGVA